jgi:hypothetical protein
MGKVRKRTTEDKNKVYLLPDSLVVNLFEALSSINTSKRGLSKLQYWQHLEIITSVCNRSKMNEEGYVSLDATFLKDTVGSRYKDWIKNLMDIDVFEVLRNEDGLPIYSKKNHQAKQYRLTSKYRNDDLVEVEGAKRVSKTKPKKNLSNLVMKRLLADVVGYPEYSFLLNNLHHLSYDIPAVEKDLKLWLNSGAEIKGERFTEKNYHHYLNQCIKFNGDAINFKLEIAKRISSSLTSSHKATRKHLKLHGYTGTLYQSDLTSV